MSYGIIINRATGQKLADPTMLGGRLFVQRIVQSPGTDGFYTFDGVPTGDDLIIATVQPGYHSRMIQTIDGSATLTLTSYGSSQLPPQRRPATELLVFAKKTKEPDYGCAIVNNFGERLVSTVYPCPRFLQKGTPSAVASNGTPYAAPYQTEWNYYLVLPDMAIDSTRFVLWEIPDDTSNDVFYNFSGALLVPGESNFLTYSILCDSATAPPALTGYIFQVDNITSSFDNYGIRIKNAIGQTTFDSGLNHLVIDDLTSNLFFDYPPVNYGDVGPLPITTISTEIPAFLTTANPIIFPPRWARDVSIPAPTSPGGSILMMSTQFVMRGYLKREGKYIKLAALGYGNQEDVRLTYSFEFGGFNQVLITASGTNYQ